MGIARLRIIYLLLLSLLMVTFQNCGRASFRNLNLATSLKAIDTENGSVFDGKPTFYQTLPDFKCEGKPANRSSIRWQSSSAYLTLNQNDHCGALLDQPVDPKDIDSSKFDSDYIGYRDGIYERAAAPPDLTKSAYNEVLCQSTAVDSPLVDVAIQYDEKNQQAMSKIYYDKNGQPRTVPFFKVLRSVDANEAKYSADSFNLVIDRSQPSPQKWWYFSGMLDANLETGYWKGVVRCRMQAGKLLTSVQKLYAQNGDWNSYVNRSNASADVLKQLDVSCSGSSKMYSDCLHGGDKLVVRTDGKRCAELQIKDGLDAFDWICEDQSEGAVFYSTNLKYGHGLSDLVTASSWRENIVQISDRRQVIYESIPMSWWKNLVLPLPINGTGGTLSLNQQGAVYVAATSSSSVGYSIDQNQISLVIKPGAILSAAPILVNNCVTIGGSLAPNGYGPPLKCLVNVNSHGFIWIEGDFAANGSNANTMINLISSAFIRLQNVKTSGGVGYGIYQNFLMASVFDQVVSDSNQFGLVSYFSEGNLMNQISFKNNSYAGLVFGAWDNNNTITQSQALNNGTYGYEIISALNLKMSSIRASNHTNSGIAFEGFTDNVTADNLFLSQNNFGLNDWRAALGSKKGNRFRDITLVGNNTGIEIFKDAGPTAVDTESFSGYLKMGNLTDCSIYTLGTGAYRASTCPGIVGLGSALYSPAGDFSLQTTCHLSADNTAAICGP